MLHLPTTATLSQAPILVDPEACCDAQASGPLGPAMTNVPVQVGSSEVLLVYEVDIVRVHLVFIY